MFNGVNLRAHPYAVAFPAEHAAHYRGLDLFNVSAQC